MTSILETYTPSLFPPDRPPAFVRNLERLPPSMVDRVVKDLPIIRVLQILCHGKQTLKDRVYLNKPYQGLRSPSQYGSSILDLFQLYRDIYWFRHIPLTTPTSRLAAITHTHSEPQSGQRLFQEIEHHLKDSIVAELFLSAGEQTLLARFSASSCPSLRRDDLPLLVARWDWIKLHMTRLNAAKAGQLEAVADIIAAYPGKVMLKKPLDPSQKGPRPNTQHIIDYFRGAARKTLKTRRFGRQQPQPRCYKGIDNIELLLYDKYLWLFLDTIKKYPPANRQNFDPELGEMLDGVTLDNPSTASHPGPREPSSQIFQTGSPVMEKQPADGSADTIILSYPANIALGISVVMKGLVNVYTGSPLLIVPRINWNPSSTITSLEPLSELEPVKPIFYIGTKSHILPHEGDLKVLHRCPLRKILPYDEREYEWLKAFLTVVTWMEGNLPEKK